MRPRPNTPPVPTAIIDWTIWYPLPSGSAQGSTNASTRRRRYSEVITRK
jgi:hypothetical protein